MITFKEFNEMISLNKEFNLKLEELEEVLGHADLFEIRLVQIAFSFFDNYIMSHFTKEGSDLVFWWLYESVPKVIYDSEVEYNVEDLEDLWDYIVKNNYLK